MIGTQGYDHPGPIKKTGGRDHVWEGEAFDRIRAECLSRYGFDGEGYVAAIKQRFAIGAQVYGDNAFMERDNMLELREETPDVACYALLEIERHLQMDEEIPGDVMHHLWEAVMAGALADFHARKVKELLKNG